MIELGTGDGQHILPAIAFVPPPTEFEMFQEELPFNDNIELRTGTPQALGFEPEVCLSLFLVVSCIQRGATTPFCSRAYYQREKKERRCSKHFHKCSFTK